MVAAGHFRNHKKRGDRNVSCSAKDGGHAYNDKRRSRLIEKPAKDPPSIAPTKRLGAKTPPDPPDETVSERPASSRRGNKKQIGGHVAIDRFLNPTVSSTQYLRQLKRQETTPKPPIAGLMWGEPAA